MNETNTVRFGKYLILDKIAIGGMAELFRAKITGDQGFEKIVVIKKILPHLSDEEALVNSFIDEAKLAAFLHHENIIQIYDFGNMEGAYFIAMEYLSGKDLRAITSKSKLTEMSIALENALYIASKICAGLDYSHKLKDFKGNPLNIIHRDISPQNIFITYDGQVKIIDFGIAKAASHNETTQQGLVKGKLAYMSPEQADGKEMDHRSDLFSTGILLYEMVTGHKMFEGETFQIYSQVRAAEFEPPQNLAKEMPPGLFQIIGRALAKNPDQRYQTGGEMLADLEECIYNLPNRPTARGLSLFMKRLFREETAAEELSMREVIQKRSQADRPTSAGKQDPGGIEPRPEKRAEVFDETILIEERKSVREDKKKSIRYILPVILLLIIFGGFSFYFFRADPMARQIQTGMEALSRNQFPEAVVIFEKVFTHSPSRQKDIAGAYASALSGLAEEIQQKDPVRAESLLVRATEVNPDSKAGFLRLGRFYFNTGKDTVARKVFEKIGEKDPEFAEAMYSIGHIYNKNGELEKAADAYARVVETAPPFLDEALVKLGMVQEKLGELDKSIMAFQQAVMVNPDNQSARESLKKVKAKLKKAK